MTSKISQRLPSTSFHRLNGDIPSGLGKKVAYLFCNYLNNLFPNQKVDPGLGLRHFDHIAIETYWGRLDKAFTPARKWSDLFWLGMPWEKIIKELGDLRALDLGCGSGLYGQMLETINAPHLKAYKGLDIKTRSDWKSLRAKYPHFSFQEIDLSTATNWIPPGTNLIFSQSALEHIEGDVRVFQQIRDYAASQSHPVIQIHLVPARSCLWLYLLHGFRQYTPRTLSKLSSLFDQRSQTMLFTLGGRQSNRAHFQMITIPRFFGKGDKRKTALQDYDQALLAAMKEDLQRGLGEPSFYALVIQTNAKSQLFSKSPASLSS